MHLFIIDDLGIQILIGLHHEVCPCFYQDDQLFANFGHVNVIFVML